MWCKIGKIGSIWLKERLEEMLNVGFQCSICFRLHEDPFRSWTPTLPMAEDLDQEQQGRCTVFAPWDGWRMIGSYYSNISIFRLELCARMLKPGLFSQKDQLTITVVESSLTDSHAAKVWRQWWSSDMQSNRGWAARGGWFQQRWTGRSDRNHEFGWWNLRYWRWMRMKQVQWNSRTIVFFGGMVWYGMY